MGVKELMRYMVQRNASDLFYRAGGKPRLRIDEKVVVVDEEVLSVDDVVKATEELTTPQQKEAFTRTRDIDFAVYVKELDRRFRVNIFMQRNWPSIVIRNLNSKIQTFEELELPVEVLKKQIGRAHV
jgi:twitching motility protein PilU